MTRLTWLVFLSLLCLGQTSLAANPDNDFLNAREAYRVGNHSKLNASAARLHGYVLYPYVAYWQLQSRLKDSSPSEIREFLDTYADSSVADRLRADWLRLLGKEQKWDGFLNEYANLQNGDTELTCYALRARASNGDHGALAEGMSLWFTGRDMPESCSPLFEALVSDGSLGEEDIWARIRLALEDGNASLAKVIYGHLKQSFNARAFDTAASSPQRFLELNKNNFKGRLTRELAMFSVYRQARSQLYETFETWNAIRADFSESEQRYTWAQLAVVAARKHDPAALSWFRMVGNDLLNDSQLGWKVRASLRAGEWNEALLAIQAMSDKEQNDRSWRYWKGRALKTLNRIPQANAILAPLSIEHNFYGQLAKEELGAAMGGSPQNYQPSATEIKAVKEIPAIQRALKLYDLDLRYDATKEWNWAIRHFDDKHLLAAAELAQRNEWYERAINTADKTKQMHNFDLRYPAPYQSLMSTHTRQWELDEAWVYGLIRQESRFVVQAKSSVGATGLMQVMPSTAKWIAKKLGIKDKRKMLADTMDRNVEFGTYYLRYVLDKLDNQPVLATAAYNAGPTRAQRWRDLKPLEGVVYTESIPFSETRDYVKKVMSNAMYYAARFGQKFSSLKERLGTIGGSSEQNEDCQADDERSPACEQ